RRLATRVQALAEQLRKGGRGPELAEIQAGVELRTQLLEIPLEIEFRGAVICQREATGAIVREQVEIRPLHDDQLIAGRSDDVEREPQRRRVSQGLVASNDAAGAIGDDRSGGAEFRERVRQRLLAPRRAAIGVL